MSDNVVTLKKSHIVIISVVVVALFVCAIVFGLNFDRWFGQPTNYPSIDPGAQDWVGETLPDQGGESGQVGIKIPGYPSLTLPADTANVSVAFLNPEGNPCYFVFELVLTDTEEVLYTSKLVPPGKAIYSIELSRALSAGHYNAEIRISTFSLEDGVTPMNGANVETILIIEQQ